MNITEVKEKSERLKFKATNAALWVPSGTKLLTRIGWERVENIGPNTEVLTLNEYSYPQAGHPTRKTCYQKLWGMAQRSFTGNLSVLREGQTLQIFHRANPVPKSQVFPGMDLVDQVPVWTRPGTHVKNITLYSVQVDTGYLVLKSDIVVPMMPTPRVDELDQDTYESECAVYGFADLKGLDDEKPSYNQTQDKPLSVRQGEKRVKNNIGLHTTGNVDYWLSLTRW